MQPSDVCEYSGARCNSCGWTAQARWPGPHAAAPPPPLRPAAAIARRVYINQGLGVGQFRRIFGGRSNAKGKVVPEHYRKVGAPGTKAAAPAAAALLVCMCKVDAAVEGVGLDMERRGADMERPPEPLLPRPLPLCCRRPAA